MQCKENSQKNSNISEDLINQIINKMSKSDIDQFMKQFNANKEYLKSPEKHFPKKGRPKKIRREVNSTKKNQTPPQKKENISTSGIVDLTNDTDISEKKNDKLNLTTDVQMNQNSKRKRGRPLKNKSEEPKKIISENILLNRKRGRPTKNKAKESKNKIEDSKNKNDTSLNDKHEDGIYATPELKNVLSLEKEYGLSKIINCLYKPNIDKSNNDLEKNMYEIIKKINLQKTLALLLQIQTMSPSDKTKILDDSKNETTIDLIEDDEPKNNISLYENNKKKINKNLKAKTEIKAGSKKTTEIKSVENLKNFENLEPCMHYHKEKGDIYKFGKHHLIDMKKTWVFYCCDKDCEGQATYEISTKKFKNIHDHTKSNKEHSYIKKIEIDKNISNFKNTNFNEAQVFKKSNGTKIIHWYN